MKLNDQQKRWVVQVKVKEFKEPSVTRSGQVIVERGWYWRHGSEDIRTYYGPYNSKELAIEAGRSERIRLIKTNFK